MQKLRNEEVTFPFLLGLDLWGLIALLILSCSLFLALINSYSPIQVSTLSCGFLVFHTDDRSLPKFCPSTTGLNRSSSICLSAETLYGALIKDGFRLVVGVIHLNFFWVSLKF